jgi:AcrR family transcriptional regulator
MPKVSEEHRAARREQIIDAAIRCVGREGFHRTTMSHVVAESGLSAGAVYGYFKGKDDLIKAIAGRALGGFAELLHGIATGPGPVTPAGALRAMVSEVERLSAASDGAFPKVVMHAWSEAARDPDVLSIVGENVDRVHEAWLDVLSRARADGNFTGPGSDSDMARALIGLMPGFVLQGLLLGKVDGQHYCDGFESLTAH